MCLCWLCINFFQEKNDFQNEHQFQQKGELQSVTIPALCIIYLQQEDRAVKNYTFHSNILTNVQKL